MPGLIRAISDKSIATGVVYEQWLIRDLEG